LLELRKRNGALSANASFKKISIGDDKTIYAFIRENGNQKVLVILNFSGNEQALSIKDPSLTRKAYSVFEEKEVLLNTAERKIKPWGYEVYEY
jgi:glycosidase